MAFDFPSSPAEGTLYGPPGGPAYVYTGGVWRMQGGAQTATAEARNRIVNGAMQVSQENGNTSVGMATAPFPVDQWVAINSSGTFAASAQRVQVKTPKGSLNRIRATITSGGAIGSASCLFYQNIEGNRVADFQYGSATAVQSVLRFGWKSPAGTYSIAIRNNGLTRSFIGTFTVSAGQANTDTEQMVVIPGDVTGTWLTDTGIGLQVNFIISSPNVGIAGWQAGNFQAVSSQTNGGATTGNTFELFDVGLYLDPNATGVPPPWQMPDEAQELAACQRYYQPGIRTHFSGNVTSGLNYVAFAYMPPMRTTATLTGAVSSVQSFPNTVGTLVHISTGTGCTETRVANAAGAGVFSANVAANARM